MSEHTALFLNEQKITTVQHATILTDEYALMHKTAFVRHQSESGLSSQKQNVVCQSNSNVKFRRECCYYH